MDSIFDGIIIGGAGGAIAGLVIWLIDYARERIANGRDADKIYEWLEQNTSDEAGNQFRSTRAIASWTNLTQERVRLISSLDKRIFLSTGEREDMWGIHEHVPRSVYEDRGVLNV